MSGGLFDIPSSADLVLPIALDARLTERSTIRLRRGRDWPAISARLCGRAERGMVAIAATLGGAGLAAMTMESAHDRLVGGMLGAAAVLCVIALRHCATRTAEAEAAARAADVRAYRLAIAEARAGALLDGERALFAQLRIDGGQAMRRLTRMLDVAMRHSRDLDATLDALERDNLQPPRRAFQ